MPSPEGLIQILIYLLIFIILLIAVKWAIEEIPLPERAKRFVWLIVGIIALIALLYLLLGLL